MPRMIDADALIAPLKKEYKKLKQAFNETSIFQAPNDVVLYGALMQELGAIIGMIEDAKTIDAVPVIRCYECKHYDKFISQNIGQGWCDVAAWRGRYMRNDDFCSRAEPKEEIE